MIYTDWPLLGKKVSAFAMGSGNFGTGMTEQTAFDILDAYVALGGNVLDTARVYGDFIDKIGTCEEVIGRWMEARGARDQVILSTKGGHPPMSDMTHSRLDQKSVHSDLEDSLEALRTDHVDLYYLHRDDERRSVGEILETLNALVDSGKVGLLGASNWKPARIEEANRYAATHGLKGFSVNQPQWSLAHQYYVADATLEQMDRTMYDMHLRTGLACMTYSSQGRGFFLKLNEMGEDAMPEALKRDFLHPENLRIYEIILKLREETNLSIGAITLAFLAGQTDFLTIPIVGASSTKQVDALKESADARLSPDAMRALLQASGLIDG